MKNVSEYILFANNCQF